MAFAGPVVIIGGGIGGMSLAAALDLVGIRADVFEQAPAIREVGAGVGLWPNGLASLDQIGAGDAVRASCRPLRRGEMVNPRGQVLQSYDIDALGGAFGGAALRVVHRADLLAAIHARVPAERVHVGRRCVGVDGGEGAALARFEDGSTAEGALLVGADGLRSVARRAVLGDDPIRYSGQTCFRGIAALRVEDPGAIREIQGPGQRCAVCPITDELVYWWAAYNAPEGAIVPEGRRRAHLRERYRGWPFGFEALLEATPEEAFLQNDLLDRAPVKRWSRGRLALLGDAAHPTTPNLGQGANMAIDDAIVLARELARGDDPVAAVNRYEAARVARTSMIVRRSWTFGQLCRWERAPLVWLRELLVKGAPERWMRAEIERQILESVGPLRPGGTGA